MEIASHNQLEDLKRRQRQRILEIEDEIEEKRKTLVAALESGLQQKTETFLLFTIRSLIISAIDEYPVDLLLIKTMIRDEYRLHSITHALDLASP